MKLKIRFLGKLWTFGKENNPPPYIPYTSSNPQTGAGRIWKEHKMAVIIFIIAIIVLLSNLVSFGQEHKIVPVKIGGEIPDMIRKNVLNNTSSTINLTDYNDRLLILDFWFTRCGSCIEGMPDVAALQKKYGDKIKIIEVDFEKPEQVLDFFRKYPNLKNLDLPVIYNDVDLAKMFPHLSCPHIVWINKGVYMAATEADYLISKNIDSILSNKNVELKTKIDIEHWDFKRPFLEPHSLPGLTPATRTYGTYVLGYLGGIESFSRIVKDSVTGDTRTDLINFPLLNLYNYIFNSGLPTNSRRRILRVKNKSRYVNEPHIYEDVWIENNGYSIESIVPKDISEEQVRDQIRTILESDLGIAGSIEKVETDVLVIKNRGTGPKPSLYKENSVQLFPGFPMFLHYIDANYLADFMNAPERMLPVIDETGSKLCFDLNLPVLPNDAATWRKVVAAAGLELIPCKRTIDMFVLHEKDYIPTLSKPSSVINQP